MEAYVLSACVGVEAYGGVWRRIERKDKDQESKNNNELITRRRMGALTRKQSNHEPLTITKLKHYNKRRNARGLRGT